MEHAARFRTLDGARGVAAVLVVLFHVSQVYAIPKPASAYLAVDMFFALSGFVLARTYEDRFAAGMSVGGFMKARARRLFPLYLAGLAFGLIELAIAWQAGQIGVKTLAGTALFGVVLLPAYVPFHPHRLFPADGPAWSLFCEYWIANLAFVMLWRYITSRRLIAVLALSAAALSIYAWRHHGLDQGSTWGTLAGAVLRVVFSFTAGLALWRWYRTHRPRFRVPGGAVLLVLAVLLCVPVNAVLRPVYDCACVLFAFPALIYFGAGATERRPQLGSLAGDISYAVYILHAPMLGLYARWQPSAAGQHDLIAAVAFVIAIAVIGWLAHRVDQAARIAPSRRPAA